MTQHDKEGFDLIKKGFDQDYKTAKENINTALDKEFGDKEYVGPQELQKNAEKTVNIQRNQEYKERTAEARKRLEQLHYHTDMDTAHKLMLNEEKILAAKDRFRKREQNPEQVREPYTTQPGSMRSEFQQNKGQEHEQQQKPEREPTREEHIETLKNQWRENANDISRDRDQGMEM